MWRYTLRRLYQSLFILIGVALITFVLFRLSAGDPTAVLLGKNPDPAQVEQLRSTLGADKPLFYGHDCVTECFASADYTNAYIRLPGVEPDGDSVQHVPGKGLRGPLTLTLKRRLPAIAARVTCDNGTIYAVDSAQESLVIAIPEGDYLRAFRTTKYQDNAFNSQFFDTFRELVSFHKTFPYVSFLNFGMSITQNEPVRDILLRGVGPSLALMIPVFLGELFLGILLALLATRYKNRWVDVTIMTASVALMSISYLAFILFGQYVLAFRCGFFPVWGFESAAYLILPVLIGILSGLGGSVRFYRTVFVNELASEYLRTAKAKGASTFQIFAYHLLPNAFIPIISRISVTLPFLFTGSLLLEKFFGIPGLGYAGISALNEADIQLLKAIVVISTLLFLVINILTDILYAWADPRIRLQ